MLVLEGASPMVYPLFLRKNGINLYRRYVDYIAGLTGYCAHGVLRDPRMWLGIFVGG